MLGSRSLAVLGNALTSFAPRRKGLSPVDSTPWSRNGWFPVIRESFSGAWQRNITYSPSQLQAFHAVWACQSRIAQDIAKLRLKLVRLQDGIWSEFSSPSFSPVLRKPNHFQTRIQMMENWVLSKLSTGNTYVLKMRDDRGVVTDLFVLDPHKVMPRVSDDGQIFYELQPDNLLGITTGVIVPAREIIHDRMNAGLFHPLIGVPPLYAAGLAATQGLQIQNNSTRLFANNSSPGGLLTAPGDISSDAAAEMSDEWEAKFGGENVGRVAVLGNGLQFTRMSLTAVDAQLIDQLKWAAENVCSAYLVPPYKIGIGEMPKYTNIQALNIEYGEQCLQIYFENIELLMDEGLGIGDGVGDPPYYGTEFATEDLLRMDTLTQMEVLDKGKWIMKPDEQRAKLGLPKAKGGDVVYRQEQDHSLEALAKRDAKDDPFSTTAQQPAAQPPPAAPIKDGGDGRINVRIAAEGLVRRSYKYDQQTLA